MNETDRSDLSQALPAGRMRDGCKWPTVHRDCYRTALAAAVLSDIQTNLADPHRYRGLIPDEAERKAVIAALGM